MTAPIPIRDVIAAMKAKGVPPYRKTQPTATKPETATRKNLS